MRNRSIGYKKIMSSRTKLWIIILTKINSLRQAVTGWHILNIILFNLILFYLILLKLMFFLKNQLILFLKNN